MRPGGQRAHQLGVEEVACRDIVVDQAARNGRVAERVKNGLKFGIRGKGRALGGNFVDSKNFKQAIAGADAVLVLDQTGVKGILEQRVKSRLHGEKPPK